LAEGCCVRGLALPRPMGLSSALLADQ